MEQLTEWLSADAEFSLGEALKTTNKANMRLRASLEQLIRRRCEGERIILESEGNLPDGKRFYAIVKKPIRCYCWIQDGRFCISHYIHKKWTKLRPEDTERVCKNWREFNRA